MVARSSSKQGRAFEHLWTFPSLDTAASQPATTHNQPTTDKPMRIERGVVE